MLVSNYEQIINDIINDWAKKQNKDINWRDHEYISTRNLLYRYFSSICKYYRNFEDEKETAYINICTLEKLKKRGFEYKELKYYQDMIII